MEYFKKEFSSFEVTPKKKAESNEDKTSSAETKEVAPVAVKVELVHDTGVLKKILDLHNSEAVQRRRKQDQQNRRNAPKMKIKICDGHVFDNMQKLKHRVREIQSTREDGEELNPQGQDFALIKALLKFHPRGDEKMKDMKGIKVDVSEQGNNRCFWIIREGENAKPEDFSMIKIYAHLENSTDALFIPDA